uniref:Uncharacterized protein n=1 Tax=Triticum urartu TaxID=4572 RepID=A0A8R7TLL3_TRIUA
MEGSSAMSPLGEPIVPKIANCVPTLSDFVWCHLTST